MNVYGVSHSISIKSHVLVRSLETLLAALNTFTRDFEIADEKMSKHRPKKYVIRYSFLLICFVVASGQHRFTDTNKKGLAFLNFLTGVKQYTGAKIAHFIVEDEHDKMINFMTRNNFDMLFKVSKSLNPCKIKKDSRFYEEPVIIIIISKSNGFKIPIIREINADKDLFDTVSIVINKPQHFKSYKLLDISPSIRLFAFQFLKVRQVYAIRVYFYYTNYNTMKLNQAFFGGWTEKTGLKTAIPFERCCYNLSGYPIKVTHIGDYERPFAEIKPTSNNSWLISGLTGDVFTCIVKFHGIRITSVYKSNGSYGIIDQNGNPTGLLKELAEKRADVAIGSLTSLLDWDNRVDFTIGIFSTSFTGIYKEKLTKKNLLSLYYQPFSENTWILITTSFIVMLLILLIFMRFLRIPLSNNFIFDVFGADLNQGIWRETTNPYISLEIFFVIATILGMLLSIFYGSKLIANKAYKKTEIRFRSLLDVAESTQYHPLSWQETGSLDALKSSSDPEYVALWKRMLIDGGKSIISDIPTLQLEIDDGRAIYIGTTTFLKYFKSNHPEYSLADFQFSPTWIVMVLQKNSPLTRKFDLVIRTMIESGAIDRIKRTYEARDIITESVHPEPIEFYEIAILLCILAAGIFFSFIIIVVELFKIRKRDNMHM